MGIILVAEDNPEEQIKAKRAISKSGNKFVVGGTLNDVNRLLNKLGKRISGILTDIHFPEREGSGDNNPSGLAIVIRAIREGIPVSICSDINHHYALYLGMIVDDLEQLTGQTIPFTQDTKDWQLALRKLKKVQREKR